MDFRAWDHVARFRAHRHILLRVQQFQQAIPKNGMIFQQKRIRAFLESVFFLMLRLAMLSRF